MVRRSLVLAALVAVATVGPVGSVVAGDATTTRIEPRPFYGAVITVEEGVRVFRPLPRVKHVIINPNGTPLNLTIEERREVSRNYHYYSAAGEAGASGGYSGVAGGTPYGLGAGGRHGGHGFVRHRGGIGVHGFRGYRAVRGHGRGHGQRGHRGAKGGKRH
ncbi:MAG: hypothetical protein R3D27_08890 [Hyphomicrobiaceae bacterium]